MSAAEPDPATKTPSPGAACPLCDNTYPTENFGLHWKKAYEHLRSEHGWSEEEVEAHKASRGVLRAVPAGAGKVNRDRKSGGKKEEPKAAGATKPKMTDFERRVKESQEASAWIERTLNPLLLQGAVMFGAPPPLLVNISGGYPVINLNWESPTDFGRQLQLNHTEALVFGTSYAFSKDTWWAKRLEEMLPKLLPPILGVAVATVTVRYARRVESLISSEMFAKSKRQWEDFLAQAAMAQREAADAAARAAEEEERAAYDASAG